MSKPTHILVSGGGFDDDPSILRISDIVAVAELNGITMGETGVEYYGSEILMANGQTFMVKESVYHVWHDMTGIRHPKITRRFGH